RFGEAGGWSRGGGVGGGGLGLGGGGGGFPLQAALSPGGGEGQRFFPLPPRDVTERSRQEDSLRRSRDEIRALGLAASNLREQEKSRVARELHDERGQALTALKIDAAWMKEQVGDKDLAIQRKLASMQLLLDGTVAATRRIAA